MIEFYKEIKTRIRQNSKNNQLIKNANLFLLSSIKSKLI